MKRQLLLFYLLVPLLAAAQDSTATCFINYLNEYNADSLSLLLTDDFRMKRTYADYENDKQSLLGNYLRASKASNSKFIIQKTIRSTEPVQYLVEDRSDYLTYLNIKNPYWKITISSRNGKVSSVLIDTIGNAGFYFEEIRRKMELFTRWMSKEYPGEMDDKVYTVRGLLVMRLREFAGLEDSH